METVVKVIVEEGFAHETAMAEGEPPQICAAFCIRKCSDLVWSLTTLCLLLPTRLAARQCFKNVLYTPLISASLNNMSVLNCFALLYSICLLSRYILNAASA